MPAHIWVEEFTWFTPPGKIIAGRDHDGIDLIVGRAMHSGDLLPAKVKLEQGIAYVPYDGEEHMKHNFEVLLMVEYKWIPSQNGCVPQGAFVAGRTSDGESLYVGRAMHAGVTCIGKVHPSHGVMYIPYGGREIAISEYEVLVQN